MSELDVTQPYSLAAPLLVLLVSSIETNCFTCRPVGDPPGTSVEGLMVQ